MRKLIILLIVALLNLIVAVVLFASVVLASPNEQDHTVYAPLVLFEESGIISGPDIEERP